MGIDDNRTRNPIQIAEQQVGGFSADTGKPKKIVHIIGHPSVMLFKQNDSAVYQITGFGMIETTGVDVFLHFFHIRFGKGFKSGKTRKKGRCDHVYARIGTLCREPDGKQQFIIFVIIQRTDCFRILCQKKPDDFIDLFLSTHGKSILSYFRMRDLISERKNTPPGTAGCDFYQRFRAMFPPHSMVSRFTPL